MAAKHGTRHRYNDGMRSQFRPMNLMRQQHGWWPMSTRPGRSVWPRGQRSGGLTMHCSDVDLTSSPTAAIRQR